MKVLLQNHLTIYCRWLRWINDHELVVACSLFGNWAKKWRGLDSSPSANMESVLVVGEGVKVPLSKIPNPQLLI